jgi:hemolysin D
MAETSTQQVLPEDPPKSLRQSLLSRRRSGRTADRVLRDFQPHALAIEERPPSPFTGIVLWTLAALLATSIAWSAISHIPIMATAPGKFTTDAPVKVVQSLNTGTVDSILVVPGAAVTKGQALVTLDPKVDLEKVTSASKDLAFNRLQQRRIRSELDSPNDSRPTSSLGDGFGALERRLANAQLASQRSKIAVDEAQVRVAQANWAAGNATLDEYGRRAVQDTDLAKAATPLVSEGAISGAQYTQLEDQAIVAEGQLMAQRQQMDQLAAALAAAQKQLDEDKWVFQSDRYQELEQNVGKEPDLNSQYAQAARDEAVDELKAPVTGIVQSLELSSLGSVIQVGQTVATIVPSDAPLVVEVDLPASDIGFVKVGQRTQIKVTAYPFEEYGSIPGKVLWISPTADSSSDLSALPEGDSHQPVQPQSQSQAASGSGSDQTKGVPPPTLYYRVKVQPERTWLVAEGSRNNIRPGMTASVDIETGRRRVLAFFLDPVVKYIRNGVTVP